MSRTNTADPATDLEALREDLTSLKTDLASLARSVMERGKSKAAAAGEQVKDKVQAGLDSAEDVIQSHPFSALAIAFFGGMIAGAILRRGA